MARFYVILGIIEIAFVIFTLVDVILTEEWRIRRGIPKVVWVIIVLLLSPIGAILWFVVGKEPIDRTGPARPLGAPDDDPAFLYNLRRDEERDERIRRLEQQLSELDDDPPKE
jgi:Phospholipase_D-nuclease N-terminal